jgi:hypothetical protein
MIRSGEGVSSAIADEEYASTESCHNAFQRDGACAIVDSKDAADQKLNSTRDDKIPKEGPDMHPSCGRDWIVENLRHGEIVAIIAHQRYFYV